MLLPNPFSLSECLHEHSNHPMPINELLSSFASLNQAKQLVKAITQGEQEISVSGLKASLAAIIFASIKDKLTKPLLFVMDDKDEAGYLYSDLCQLIGDDDVLFFPSSYRRSIKYNQIDTASEILRSQALLRLQSEHNKIFVVSYPEALIEASPQPKLLTDSTISLSKGSCHDFASLEDKLIALGFKLVDYVYEPGQFAIRGSIIDIFSFTNELPYRIDFFGDEIDSIREFDVQSQLSQKTIEHMVAAAQIVSESNLVPFFDFLVKDSTIIYRDPEFLLSKIHNIYHQDWTKQARQEDEIEIDYRKLLVSPKQFSESFSRFHHISISASEQAHSICFDCSYQPLFHKNFDLLKESFARLKSEGYKIYVLAEDKHQTDRLKEILNKQHSFVAINKALHEGFIDHNTKQALFTDHQIFDRYHKYNLKSDKAHRGKIALSLKELKQFGIGDYVVHIDHGVGRFAGLVRVPQANGTMQEMIKLTYLMGDVVYVSIHALHKLSKYKGKDGCEPKLHRLGGGAWDRMKERVKSKVKDIARELIALYAKRQKEKGFAFSPDSYLQHELEASFVYEDTPDQYKATLDVKADMEKQEPMDRLICGDVGFGKTEIAIRAAFKAACDGKQVAVLVPTTILAYQHYKTFSERLKDMPVRVDYITRARSTKELHAILSDLREGKIDIIIGTHKLVGKDIVFNDLGLLVIDEEQKFGVSVKEKLRQMKSNVDTLTMTATPIPRTLQFSIMGARDLSVIATPPENRYPILTEIHQFSSDVIAEAINFEMSRNGQIFIVNDKISNLEDIKRLIDRSVKDARVCICHGRMSSKEMEQAVLDFMNHDYDVLLSTTIMENGIDVPNANTIIINNAHHYGLSDLHQMRGRVGRSNRKAFCYLLAPPLSLLPADTRRRLQAIENFSELGSGLNIAMQDLDIRGAGNILGAEQSGFIADLGYETYQKVLAEAIHELKIENGKLKIENGYSAESPLASEPHGNSQFVMECIIESDIAASFSEAYVPTSSERMSLYRELDSLQSEEQLEAYRARLVDRFGALQSDGEELLKIMPLKWAAAKLGFERLILKNKQMIGYLVSDHNSPYYQSEAFASIISFATKNIRRCRFRQGAKPSIEISNISSIADALALVRSIMT